MLRPASFTTVLLLAIGAWLAASPSAIAAQDPERDAFDALVEAERSFARAAHERGIRASFLEWLAEGATMFDPLPADGREIYEARPETGALLAWRPDVAEIAGAGDFGWTSGPWSYHPDGVGSAAVAHGHFVSVWRRQADGEWRVEVDAGVSHDPRPDADSSRVDRAGSDGSATPSPDTSGRRAELLAADRGLTAALAMGPPTADLTAGDVRTYRDGAPPALGRDAWTAAVSGDRAFASGETSGHGLAASADLGYTFGILRSEAAAWSYYRIWRRTPAGWRLVVDLTIPPPPPAPADDG